MAQRLSGKRVLVTAAGQVGYAPPPGIRSDQFLVRGVRLPFQKFLRNPRG